MFGDIPLGFAKVLSSGFLSLVTSGLSNFQRGISFVFRGFYRRCLKGLKLILFFCLFPCRMTRGHEETSTSQIGRKRGISQEMPTISSLVVAMFVEELRSFSQVPVDIRLEVADGPAAPTIGGADNAVYFTREQFVVELVFHIPSLVKQFMYFTRAPPALIHPNVFWILMGLAHFVGRDLFYLYFEAWG